jgi:secretion/DNA translocation related TadE-like protein
MRSEAGSVSVVVAAVVGMALVVTMGVADVGRALVARSRAEAVADLAALAAAQEIALPSGSEPAALAEDYASRNGARLLACSCEIGSSEAVVRVSVEVGGFLLPLAAREVVGTARAVVDLPASSYSSSRAVGSRATGGR